jgi:hypothetical protein
MGPAPEECNPQSGAAPGPPAKTRTADRYFLAGDRVDFDPDSRLIRSVALGLLAGLSRQG